MQKVGFIKSKKFNLAFRACIITFFFLSCGILAVYFMGKAYSTMELTAFGNETVFLKQLQKDEFLIFGKTVYFPINSWLDRATYLLKTYSPGIIKLLNYAISIIKESADLIFTLF